MVLSFFKIYVQHSHSQMRIPAAFVNQFGFESKKYGLDGPQSFVYVCAEQNGKEWFFGEGWEKFAQDHSLEFGDFLFFEYAGNGTFQVRVHDKSCGEKHRNIPPSKQMGKSRECVITEKRVEAAATELVSESEYPAFYKVLNGSYVDHGFLSIPAKFYRKYMEGSEEGATVRLEVGDKAWELRMNIPSGRSGRLSAGWLVFLSENGLKVGDACVFQLVHTRDLVFKVACFRCSSPH